MALPYRQFHSSLVSHSCERAPHYVGGLNFNAKQTRLEKHSSRIEANENHFSIKLDVRNIRVYFGQNFLIFKMGGQCSTISKIATMTPVPGVGSEYYLDLWVRSIDRNSLDCTQQSVLGRYESTASIETKQRIYKAILANLARYENPQRLTYFVLHEVDVDVARLFDTGDVPYRFVLSEALVDVNQNPKEYDKNWTLNGINCAICQIEESPEEKVQFGYVTVQCGHNFHYYCMKTWVVVKNTCPVCREQLTSWIRRDANYTNVAFICEIGRLALPMEIADPAPVGILETIGLPATALDESPDEDEVTDSNETTGNETVYLDVDADSDDTCLDFELGSMAARQRARERRRAIQRLFRLP